MYDKRVVLIREERTQNEIGEFVVEEHRNAVFAEVRSVTRNEFFAGGERGLRPEYAIKMPIFNYHNEEELEFRGNRYAVYRTYENFDTEEIELYVEHKVGKNA